MNHLESPAEAFRSAVEIIGSQNETAAILEMTQPAISKILARGGSCPLRNQGVLKIEAASGVSRHRLAPDVYPIEVAAPDRAGDLDQLEPAE